MSLGNSEKWILVEWGNNTKGIVHSRCMVNVEQRVLVPGCSVVIGQGGEQQVATLLARSNDRWLLERILLEDGAGPSAPSGAATEDEDDAFSASGSSWVPSDDDDSDSSAWEVEQQKEKKPEKIQRKPISEKKPPLKKLKQGPIPRKINPRWIPTPSNRVNAVVPNKVQKPTPRKPQTKNNNRKRKREDENEGANRKVARIVGPREPEQVIDPRKAEENEVVVGENDDYDMEMCPSDEFNRSCDNVLITNRYASTRKSVSNTRNSIDTHNSTQSISYMQNNSHSDTHKQNANSTQNVHYSQNPNNIQRANNTRNANYLQNATNTRNGNCLQNATNTRHANCLQNATNTRHANNTQNVNYIQNANNIQKANNTRDLSFLQNAIKLQNANRRQNVNMQNPINIHNAKHIRDHMQNGNKTHNANNKENGYNRPNKLNGLENIIQIDDEIWVPIGSGKTLVNLDKYKVIKWNTYTMATRGLLLACFPRRVLATHSLTGKRSPAFQDKPAKMCLDPKKVSDIIWHVAKEFEVKESLVRNAITTKCADECKMFRMRMEKRKNLLAQKEKHTKEMANKKRDSKNKANNEADPKDVPNEIEDPENMPNEDEEQEDIPNKEVVLEDIPKKKESASVAEKKY